MTKQAHRQDIATHFTNKKSPSSLLRMWSNKVDQRLRYLWETQQLPTDHTLSLIALGGYGRKELFPESDIDLLILTDGDADEQLNERIRSFLQSCWDVGLRISHSVRSLEQCKQQTKHDLSSYTALLEARILVGDSVIYEQLMLVITGDYLWQKTDFVRAKLTEYNERFIKYDAVSYKLEPNIKNCPGGLRDIHLIDWLATKCFNTHSLENLIEYGGLTRQEYYQIISCRYFLWKVRLSLHVLTGRSEERLLFDYQYDIAKQLGFDHGEREQTIEAFMQEFYCNIRIININCKLFIKWLSERFLHPGKQHRESSINNQYKIIDRHITTINPYCFQYDPSSILEIFLFCAQYNCLGFRAKTVRELQAARDRIGENYQNDRKHQALFMAILRQPHNVAHTLRLMSELSILSRYIPEFNNTIGRMQYDLFHAYTVDHHTLLVVNNLEDFAAPHSAKKFPQCHHLFKQFKQRELLYLAAIFHDIGKGTGQDHSDLGAELALKFCQKHRLKKEDGALVRWLVQHHLLLSTTAQRRDISDPDVIKELTRKIQDRRYLDALLLLTVADIRATNKNLWNAWKAALIYQLYNNTVNELDNKPRQQVHVIQARKQQALAQLSAKKISQDKVEKVWRSIGNNYFYNHPVETIAWHTACILHHPDPTSPLIATRHHREDNISEIFIYMPDRANIFAQCVSAIDKLGFTIAQAQIFTNKEHYCLDAFHILDREYQAISDPALLLDIKQKLHHSLTKNILLHSQHRPDRYLQHFRRETLINFVQVAGKPYTILELFTLDRPGLLVLLSKAFLEFSLDLIMAKIVTLGERAEDVFYLSNIEKQAILCPDLQQQVTDRIKELLA